MKNYKINLEAIHNGNAIKVTVSDRRAEWPNSVIGRWTEVDLFRGDTDVMKTSDVLKEEIQKAAQSIIDDHEKVNDIFKLVKALETEVNQ